MTNRELVERLNQLDPELEIVVGHFETTEVESVQEERGEERGIAQMWPFHRIRLS